MTRSAAHTIRQTLNRVAAEQRVRDLPDGDLLRRFTAEQDQTAFYALIQRHGPMVRGVCSALLPCAADADDAFQATFLVLAHKAKTVHKSASVGSWLHGVAYRTARKLQAGLAERHKHERRAARPEACAAEDLTWRDVQRVVHEELGGVSERYRAPLTLCYLQGRTIDAAAAQLGLAKSTLKLRLERGRALLRARLVRRGLGPAAVLLAAAWPASAGVPPGLLDATLGAVQSIAAGHTAAGLISANVVALTEGVLNTMWTTKLKALPAAVSVLAGIGLTLGGLAYSLAAPGPRDGDDPPPAAAAKDDAKPKPAGGAPKVVREEVKGSIHHGGGKTTWYRVTGKVKVIDARTLEFDDGTRIELDIVAPDPEQMALNGDKLYSCGKEAAEFVRTLIGDRPVSCFGNAGHGDRGPWNAYAGDVNVERALVVNGWALADHSSLHADEVIARDNKRGLWRGKFVHPDDWRAGVRLPQEPPLTKLKDERQAQAIIDVSRRSDAAVAALVPRIVKDLPDVRRLNFTRTGLTDDQLAQLTALRGLEKLYLGETKVTDVGLAQLQKMRNLKYLGLPTCTPAGMAHLKALSGLKYLDLRETHVTDAGLAHVANLKEMEELFLGWAEVTDEGLSHLEGLHRLRRLTVFNHKAPETLTDAGLTHLSALRKLTYLDIHGTRLTDAGLRVLGEFGDLEYLNIRNADVTDAGVQKLTTLKRLRVLKLPERISDKTKDRLRQAIPGLKFEADPEM